FAQQRLWFIDQYEEAHQATYNIPMAFRLSGPLDVPALERSLNRLLERHEVLRTVLASDGGEPRQVIRPHRPLALEAEPLDLDELLTGLASEEELATLRRRV